MGSFDTEGLARLALLGAIAAIFILGVAAGFGVASIINLGKLCL